MRKKILFMVTVVATIFMMNFTAIADDLPPIIGPDNCPILQTAES